MSNFSNKMEPEIILKNGTSSKSWTSRGIVLVSSINGLILGILAFFCASCATLKMPENLLAFLKGQRTLDVFLN